MKKKNKNKLQDEFLTNTSNHQILSRRDFLSRWGKGIASASIIFPSLSKSTTVEEEFSDTECITSTDAEMASVLTFDLMGGSHLCGSNFIVSKSSFGIQGEDLDFDYRALGINDNPSTGIINSSKIDSSLGILMHSDSKILEGIKTILNPGGLPSDGYSDKVDGAVFCAFNFDDTNTNQLNLGYWLCNAGTVGSLGSSLGNKNTKSGGFSVNPNLSMNTKNLPVSITSQGSLTKLLQMSKLANKQTKADQLLFLNLLEQFNLSSLLQNRNKFSDSLKNRLYCDYKIPKRVLTSFTVEELLLTSNASLNDIYSGLGSNVNLYSETIMTHANLLLKKYFGVSTISMAGYDYHNGTRTTGDAADKLLGVNIGCLIKGAVDMQKNLVIYLITDGGVGINLQPESIPSGPIAWAGDRGTNSGAVMLVVNGKGGSRPVIKTTSSGQPTRQVGRVSGYTTSSFFCENIYADLTNHPITSAGGMGLAAGLFANYLALHGMESQFKEFAGVDPFDSGGGKNVMDDYIVFDQIFKLGG